MICRITAILAAHVTCLLAWHVPVAHASDHAAYCAGIYHCLQQQPKGCTDQDCEPQSGIRYSEAYCAIFRDLHARGLRTASSPGRQIYTQVAGRHRVEYVLNGALPMPAAVLTYLMNNLPFSAELINAYQGTHFQIIYLDAARRRFAGSSENLSGSFTLVLQNEQQTRSLYHGFGTTEVLTRRLSGTALVLFDFEQSAPQEVTYSLRCMVFPHSAFMRSILNFVVFRRTVLGVLDRTFSRAQESAMAFYRGEHEPVKNHAAFATPQGQQQLKEFQELLQRTMSPQDNQTQP